MFMNYKLIRSGRKTLSLIVRDGELIVRAPMFANIKFIEDFIDIKKDWIGSKINISREKYNNFEFGSKIMIFGELYTIKSNDSPATIINEFSLKIGYQGSNKRVIRTIVESYYKKQTKDFVSGIIKKYSEFSVRDITVNKYRSKWGSCTHDDRLAFSLKIAMLPKQIGEYIVVHELCHIKQKNHSKKFWDLVYNYDKEYKLHRKYLRDNSAKFNI